MVHILGAQKAHVPQTKIVINNSTPVGNQILTVKAGIESVSKDRWRAWYSSIIQTDTVTYLTAPPGGLSRARAVALAQAASAMQTVAVRMCLEQLTENALEAEAAKTNPLGLMKQ